MRLPHHVGRWARTRVGQSEALYITYHTNRNDSAWNVDFATGPTIAMDLKDVLAANLRRLRHTKQLTQEELAETSGLSARYIGAIERANVSASVTVLGRIADALEIDAADLIRRSKPRAPRE